MKTDLDVLVVSPVNGRKIVIYGGGRDGIKAAEKLSKLSITPDCVANIGKKLCYGQGYEIPIYRPDYLDKGVHFVLIASRLYAHEMEKVLRDKEFEINRDYYVWDLITTGYNDELIKCLLEISPLETEEKNKVAYLSCPSLRGNFHFASFKETELFCSFCSISSYNQNCILPTLRYSGNPKQFVTEALELKNRLVVQLSGGLNTQNSFCLGCKSLRYGIWDSDERIDRMNFTIYPSYCNLRCSYCTVDNKGIGELDSYDENPVLALYDSVKELKQRRLLDENTTVSLEAGELSINPSRELYLEMSNGSISKIVSNAYVYDPLIAERLHDKRAFLFSSIDAGTKETYKRIKGVDGFDQVCKNIAEYTKHGEVRLKYIIVVGVNDNERDYIGMINLCHKLGHDSLCVTIDWHVLGTEKYDATIHEIIKFIKLCNDEKLRVYGYECFLDFATIKKINDALATHGINY